MLKVRSSRVAPLPLAAVVALTGSCASAPVVDAPRPSAVVESAPPSTPDHWFEKPWHVSLSAPDRDGAAIALLGGRRARLFADGRVELQHTAVDAPLRWMGAVPTTGGGITWVGATRDELYRFEDPLGRGVKIFESDRGIDWVGPIPDGVVIEITGGRYVAVDARTGATREPPRVGSVPVERPSFDSLAHGYGRVPGFGDFETNDGGAAWKPAPSIDLDAGPRWGIFRPDASRTSWDSRLDPAPLTAKWLAAVGRDPLERAAEHGVHASQGTAIISGDASEIARVSLETGAVVALLRADRPETCRPFSAGGEEVHVACEGGVVRALDTSGTGLAVRWEKKVANGPFILSPDGGLAFVLACGGDDPKSALCIRQPDGSFRSVALPAAEIVGRRVSRDGSAVVATVADGSLVLTRLKPGVGPAHVATWKGCRPTRVHLDEWAGDRLRVVTVDGCDGRGPNQVLTIVRGEQLVEVLEKEACVAVGLGRVVLHTGESIQIWDDEKRVQKPATFTGGECHASAVGFQAGYEMHIGWGRLANAGVPPKLSARHAEPPLLRCSIGPVKPSTRPGSAGAGRRPKFHADSTPLFEPGLWIAMRSEAGKWHVDWWDVTEIDPRLRSLAVVAPANAREPLVVAAAASHDGLVALVKGAGPDDQWVLRKWGKAATIVHASAVGAARIALGDDGTAAWFLEAAPKEVHVLPLRGPAYSIDLATRSPLPLAPREGGVHVFAPANALAARTFIDAKVKSPPALDRYEKVAMGSPALADLKACAAGAAGHTVRLHEAMPVDAGAGARYEQLAIDVAWRDEPACIARITEQSGQFRVDFRAGVAESVASNGDVYALTCKWGER